MAQKWIPKNSDQAQEGVSDPESCNLACTKDARSNTRMEIEAHQKSFEDLNAEANAYTAGGSEPLSCKA